MLCTNSISFYFIICVSMHFACSMPASHVACLASLILFPSKKQEKQTNLFFGLMFLDFSLDLTHISVHHFRALCPTINGLCAAVCGGDKKRKLLAITMCVGLAA